MADSRLGSLAAEIIIDGGLRPHYGARDTISGKVVLSYKRYSTFLKSEKRTPRTADLFVPLKLEVSLRGKAKIIIKQERDMPTDHGGPLFLRSVEIYDGSFTAQPDSQHQFPFSIHFPDTNLPPSFFCAFQEFPDTIDLTVIYRVGVTVSIPGIEIKTTVPEHSKQPEVRYDVPRAALGSLNTRIVTHKEKAVVSTHMLLPVGQRPQNLQQRFRAVFETSPRFICEISCTEIQHIWHLYQPTFSVGIRRSEENTTTLSFPEAMVTFFRVDLVAYTWCDASKRLKGPFERTNFRTVQKLACRTALPVELTKATEYAAVLTTEEVGRGPSSFKHPLLVRRYFLKVRMKMRVAEQTVSFTREFGVEMVPKPWDLEEDDARAGPSSLAVLPPPPYNAAEGSVP